MRGPGRLPHVRYQARLIAPAQEGTAMNTRATTMFRLALAAAVLAVAGCSSVGDMFDNAQQYDGATPGTVPGHVGEPGGPMPNGLLPEPWGSTS
jgi:hypothetical protein